MQDNHKGSTVILRVVCAILFLIFIVCYVYSFQCDILAMMQYAWSDGLKHFERNIGTIVITAVTLVLVMVTSAFTRLPISFHALNYYPALFFLGMLTAARVEGRCVFTSIPWMILFLVMLALYVFAIIKLRNYKEYAPKPVELFSYHWWTNLLILFAGFCIVYSMGNTDRNLHTRLATERHCLNGNYDEALQAGFPQYDRDSSLVMLRALALANKTDRDGHTLLGERLFQYEINGGARALFPHKDGSCAFMLSSGYGLWRTIGFVPYDQEEYPTKILKRQLVREEERKALLNDSTQTEETRAAYKKPVCKPASVDYLLCAYLLDNDLKSFVRELPSYYKLDDKLPQHYREACVLYGNLSGKRLYEDASVEADCADFLTVMRKNRDSGNMNAILRDSYFGTYWYYFYTHRLKNVKNTDK